MRKILTEHLIEMGVLQPKLQAGGPVLDTGGASVSAGLTFEQRKELLLQMAVTLGSGSAVLSTIP